MGVPEQVQRLIDLGVPAMAGRPDGELAELGASLEGDGLVCVHPSLVPPSRLAPLLRHGDQPGFVVEDMTDLDEFAPLDSVDVPDTGLYLAVGVERGDEYRGVTPNAALPRIEERGRTPLTVDEGISWLLQEPEALVDDHCFMCVGSRKRRGTKLDARTPAIWISRGTGRDGPTRKNAPKVGWCWAGNHHTWLGCASAAERRG